MPSTVLKPAIAIKPVVTIDDDNTFDIYGGKPMGDFRTKYLTEDEVELVALLCMDRCNPITEVALELKQTPEYVKQQLVGIYQKLEVIKVIGFAGLIKYAIRTGISSL